MSRTRRLVEFVLDTTYDQLDPAVITLAKKHFLDCVGSALAEAAHPRSQIVQNYLNRVGAEGPCRVIGYGRSATIDNAAFANGILAHTISFDDSGPSHPSVTIVPPLLAMGEMYHLDGKAIIAAQVLAYDVFQRLNAVTEDAWEMRKRGWHPTGFFGAVTSAVLSAKLMGLTLDESVNAVAIAATMGGGLSQNIGSMGMGLHAGNASRNGIIAAHLSKEGFRADADPLEGRFGLMDALCGPGTYETRALTDGLGAPFRLLEPGITIKPYPNCWAHHKVLDSVLHLVGAHNIRPDLVERVDVDLQPDKPTYRYLEPKTDLEARYSLGYGISLCLLDGGLGLDQFADTRIEDARTRDMLARIHHVPQEPGPAQNKVAILLKDGRRLSHRVDHSKGHPRFNPMSDEDVQAKFADCAGRTLSGDQVERAAGLMNALEEVDDLALLMDALVAG
ncbi:MmgE/PrpD family protein [Tropicimonas sp. IMCC34043]|uniref:MmgE/PrpD family protein n=1 Tax=Tropicimonas sp. IMCC34043 TaxID=2248760 RepID=UPI000E231B21|nr:MmgE/PrpD family protein [Tropicimonas sp. IMCC34043]